MGVRGWTRVLALTAWFVGTAATAFAGPFDFTFETEPADGVIAGAAGSTIGWGYTVTNLDEDHWLMLTNISADVWSLATPNAGILGFPVVAPGATLTVSYLQGLSGLYEITWDSDAPADTSNSGTFIVTGQWWSSDPDLDPDAQLFDPTVDRSANYIATLTPPVTPPVSTVPEPSSLILLGIGLASCGCRVRKRT